MIRQLRRADRNWREKFAERVDALAESAFYKIYGVVDHVLPLFPSRLRDASSTASVAVGLKKAPKVT